MNEDNPFGAPEEEEADDEFSLNGPLDGDSDFRYPEGLYVVACSDVEKSVSSNENPMWVWSLKLWDNVDNIKNVLSPGEHRGKEIKNFTAITAAAMWKLREMVEGLLLGKKGENLKFKKADAIGRLCVVELQDDEYKGVKRSSIAKVYPYPKATHANPKRVEIQQVEAAGGDSDIPF